MAGIETFKVPGYEYYQNEGTLINKSEVIGDATQAKIEAFKARRIGARAGSAFNIQL